MPQLRRLLPPQLQLLLPAVQSHSMLVLWHSYECYHSHSHSCCCNHSYCCNITTTLIAGASQPHLLLWHWHQQDPQLLLPSTNCYQYHHSHRIFWHRYDKECYHSHSHYCCLNLSYWSQPQLLVPIHNHSYCCCCCCYLLLLLPTAQLVLLPQPPHSPQPSTAIARSKTTATAIVPQPHSYQHNQLCYHIHSFTLHSYNNFITTILS